MRSAVLVSGGSGGIGGALCGLLAKTGFRPIVGYGQSRAAAEAVAAACGGGVLALDLRDPSAIDAAVAALGRDTPELAGIVLAGSPPPRPGPFARIADPDMAEQWQVNVAGPQRLLAALTPKYFKRDRGGFVIGVLTRAMGEDGQKAVAGMGAYTIAKFGMAGMLAVLAADYPWLRVRTVSPGYTETAMLNAFEPRFVELMRTRVAFQRPEQVASEIMALITAESTA
ncbi:MAG: SDR family NAD(P)-dependent oxidoreductase [Xanthobacteraceae bacterium]|nr:SDR family NAD(P)-dependent oxidoreductase [Xanthobacteraceae bacterium]